ncbi:hypothetical protein [Actinomadura hibisca]|uniref:hypothetical protein n=1 Tax=Actinomadura hibisca TaxID=68565 RepID=UPI00082FD7A1|nr:hypothetical protein [Actinomadura hibisca]
MRKLGRIALPVLGTSALLFSTATAAMAAVTIYDDNTGTAYSGNVRANNIGGNVTLSGSSSLGFMLTTCTNGQLDASVLSNGTGGSLTGVSLTSCTNNMGGTTTVTALGLPYSGATVNYGPVAGGRDGTINIAAPNPAVNVKAVLTLPSVGIPSLTCNYGLTTATPLTISLYNPANANKPVPANPNSQGTLTGQSLQRLGTDARCPASVAANGKFQITAQPSGHRLRIGP